MKKHLVGIESVAALENEALQGVVQELGAEGAQLFYLDLADGNYRSVANSAERIKLDYLQEVDSEMSRELRRCAKSMTPLHYLTKLYLPIQRDTDCIGFVVVGGLTGVSPGSYERCGRYLDSLRVSYSHRGLTNLVIGIKKPISYEQMGPSEYYAAVVNSISESLGIKKVCLRQIEGGSLVCLAYTGLEPGSLADLDFEIDAAPEPFLKAIGERTCICESNAQRVKALRDNKVFRQVNSFVVVPLMRENNPWGVLSLGTAAPYTFSPLEIHSLEAVANAAEVALANFSNYRELQEQIENLADVSLSMSAVDVSQAVRHESIGYLSTANSAMAKVVRQKPGTRIDSLDEDFHNVTSSLGLLGTAIDKIRLATKPPTRDQEEFSMEDLFSKTCRLLDGGRLIPENISWRYVGKDVRIYGYKGWVQASLLNLVLNSYDAYKSRSKSGKKEIVLENVEDSAASYVFHFKDNAGGIEMHKLKLPTRLKDSSHAEDVNHVLFEPNVSSKGDSGSGYGLYLVRRGIQIHANASINVIGYRRNSTVFEIRFPKEI